MKEGGIQLRNQKSAGARFAWTVLVAVGLMSMSNAAYAQTIGTTSAPLNLYTSSLLGQAKGAVNHTATKVSTSSLAVKDSKPSNGNNVFAKVDVKATSWTSGGGLNTQTEERIRFGGGSWSLWHTYSNTSTNMVGYGTIQGSPYTTTIYTKLCEDRGIWHSDPCVTKSQSFYAY
jgi:hypothetical protein